VPDDPNPKAYPAQMNELSAKVAVQLGAPERAFYEGQTDAAEAHDEGAAWQSATVLDGALNAIRPLLPFVIEGKLHGYGALRLRYLLDLGVTLSGHVAEFDGAVVGAAGASAQKTTSLRGSRLDRRVALRVLQNLAGTDAAAKSRLKAAAKDAERPDERARSLERLAQELEAAIARVPPAVAADAGATPELIAQLRAYSAGVLGAHGAAKGARVDVASLYDTMNTNHQGVARGRERDSSKLSIHLRVPGGRLITCRLGLSNRPRSFARRGRTAEFDVPAFAGERPAVRQKKMISGNLVRAT
jgi:hypothetical protein